MFRALWLVWAGWLCLPTRADAQVAAHPRVSPAAAVVSRRTLPGEPITLITKDGWTLAGCYAAPKDGSLTFVLLHRTAGAKEDWGTMARAMVRRGMGVLALDLRGHGESQNPPSGQPSHWSKFRVEHKGYNEWNNMVQDVEAAVSYLVERGHLEDSVALGGADVGGSIALRYAALHREVPLIFLLSPGTGYRDVQTVNAMRSYSRRPILLVVGTDDRRSVTETAVLFGFAKQSAGTENATLLSVEREHGTRMLAVNRDLIPRILDWVEAPGPPLEILEPASGSSDSTAAPLDSEAAAWGKERWGGGAPD